MPEIPVSSPLGYMGVLLLILGIFLVLTGINIIKIQQVSVKSGKQTWGIGLILTLIGIAAIFIETSGFIAKKSAVRITPVFTATSVLTSTTTIAPISTLSYNPNLSTDEILREAKTWPLIHASSFDTDDGKWVLGEFKDSGEFGTWSISDRKYVWKLTAISDEIMRCNYPTLSPVEDFYLSVDVNLVEASSTGIKYGLIFRGTGETFYSFRIEDGSFYRIRIRENGHWDNLTSQISSSSIHTQQVNRLTVIADGDHFLFFINDQYVDEILDSRLPRGNVGLIVAIRVDGDEAHLEFDNFELREKP